MKKITLLLLVLFGFTAIVNAQTQSSIVVTKINGQTAADFKAAHPNLIEGEVITLTVEYKNILANPAETATYPNPRLRARVLNDYATIAGAVEGTVNVTTSTNVQTIDISFTIPDVANNIPTARLQALAYGVKTDLTNGNVFGYASQTFTLNNLTTLSTENFNKNELKSSFYNPSFDTIIIGDHVEGKYSIYDLSGKIVLNGTISSEINVSSLASGLYILSTNKGVLKFGK
ncbi:T9SS type A sorting domain-containing protein [Flavobacterium sp. UMI-01]|uniref:T9SS type A sorting domain-containing protein n=1 Tax=Flavobacterium sp. UMI-01 TaxID=1441053 RepID=UPI001C7E0727|nr:T9SS type A sorting domain-containing protein [Flavobacterium sp. UMI-01]GIZ07986.1 hypothetical protein FUMI01_07130 [Flavobacterium sp. UMI-01]